MLQKCVTIFTTVSVLTKEQDKYRNFIKCWQVVKTYIFLKKKI